jgi:Uma2 family endonuclease
MSATFDPPVRTIGDLLRRLGDIPPDRVRFSPAPGTATLRDLLRPENEGCELVEGTLVEKPVGIRESFLASWLITLLNNYVVPNNLGIVTGEAGFVELPGGPVRGPDVAFTSWARLANQQPSDPIPTLAPDFVVEVLSPSNTGPEMARKRGEYFRAGVRLVWEIDPRARSLRAYTSETAFTDHTATDTVTGGAVLPGFTLALATLFDQLDRCG